MVTIPPSIPTSGLNVKRFRTILPALIAALTLLLAPGLSARAGILPEGTQVTIRDENKMGREFDQLIRSKMSMVGDTYITDYVDDLVQKIVRAKEPMPFRIKSAVVANPILNAFAIPGGYIYIFTGLIQEVDSESQLVGVIAHELAHVSQRHVASRIEKQSKVGMLSAAGMLAGAFLGIATGNSDAGTAVMIGSQSAATAAMLQYSQADENEADHVGLNSMVRAGYNPKGMPETFAIMQRNHWFDSGAQIPSYLSTHPGLSERISYLNDRIDRMPESFAAREDDNISLMHIQPLVRSRMSPAKTALAFYADKSPSELSAMDYIGKGIAQYRLKQIDEAEKSYATALEMDRKDPLVSREAGIFYFQTGRSKEAYRYLQMAVIKNNRDALGLFYLARLEAESGNLDRAAGYMSKVLDLVPEDAEVHYHLGKIMGESGDTYSGNLHLAYAAIYSADIRKAERHTGEAGRLATSQAQKDEVKKLREIIKKRTEILKK